MKAKLEQIKDAVVNSQQLNDVEKTQTVKHIEEWILEDKAEGIIFSELVDIAGNIKPMLVEMGLL